MRINSFPQARTGVRAVPYGTCGSLRRSLCSRRRWNRTSGSPNVISNVRRESPECLGSLDPEPVAECRLWRP